MKCPNKKHKFYQELVTAFSTKYPDLDADQVDLRAFEVWFKTQLPAFDKWYGKGERDSFGEPVFNKTTLNYVGEKGDAFSVFDFRNDVRFDKIDSAKRTKEKVVKEIAEYDTIANKMLDALTTKIAIYKNKGNEEHHKMLKQLREDMSKVKAKEGMALFVNNAIGEIANSYKKLFELEKDDKLNIKALSQFRDYMSGYDILDLVRYSVKKNGDEFTSVDSSALDEAIKLRDEIKQVYAEKIKPLLASELAKVSVFSTEEQILEQLDNAPFDINSREMWLDSIVDSKDAILPLVGKLLDEAKQDVRKEHIGVREDLDKVHEALAKSKGNVSRVENLFGDMLERDVNGKLTGHLVSEYRVAEFEKERNTFKDKLKAIEDKDTKEYKDAKKEYYDWLRKNTRQRYNNKYYEILNSLSEEARDARDVYNVAIKEIMNKYKTKGGTYDVSNISDEDFDKLKENRIGLARLKNLFHQDGIEKSGKELAIARELREFSDKVSKLFERTSFDKKRFDAAQKKAKESGKDLYNEWKVKNVHLEFTQEFWDKFEKIVAKIGNPDVKDINNKINSLLKEYKDENGIVNGELVPISISKKVRELVAEKTIISKTGGGNAEVREELNNLVEFVLTQYYHTVFDEWKLKSEEEFLKWFHENHYFDDFTKSWKATRIWYTMIPKDEKHIKQESPNDNWYVTDVKPEYLNPDYKEDENGYALPTNVWRNSQYDKLLKADKDVLAYYETFKKLLKEADSKLPQGYRLGTRLPGVRKKLLTRILDNNGQNATKIIKESVKDKFTRRADDTGFGQLLNESGEPVDYIPIYYTARLPVDEQSYDLTELASMFSYMASNHEALSKVVDTIEATKHVIGDRTYSETDAKGNTKLNLLKGLLDKGIKKEGKTSNAYKQLEKFIQMQVYDQTNDDLGTIGNTNIDTAKLFDTIGGYTAYSLLSLNFIAGTLNIAQGEIMNWSEANAGRFITKRGYAWSELEYSKNTLEILGDVGARVPKNKINFINEWFDVLGKYEREVVSAQENTRFKRLMKSDMAFFLSNIGEHRLQSKVAIAMLREMKPLDSKGEAIEGLPTMYDVIIKKDGKWTFDDRVANFGDAEQKRLTRKIGFVIRRLHGNYSKATAAMWQADARLRLIGAMRKWIRPGWLRRWESRRNNEFGEVVTEGMYVTMGRVLKQTLIDLRHLQFDLMKANWNKLSKDEVENIRRTVVELGAFAIALAAGTILYALAGGEDGEKRKKHTGLLFAAYIANRLQQELTFYISPMSAISILRSPMASMSVVENIVKLLNQLRHPTERYERGNREDELKLQKRLEDLLPFYKHIYHAFSNDGIQDQMSWMK